MTPNIGQGAGMAMEDATVLAEEPASGAFIERALANYVRRRKRASSSGAHLARGRRRAALQPVTCWLRNRRVERDGRDVERSLAELERLSLIRMRSWQRYATSQSRPRTRSSPPSFQEGARPRGDLARRQRPRARGVPHRRLHQPRDRLLEAHQGNPEPYPDGYGLDHFGVHVDDLESAEARARQAGAVPAAASVDLSKLAGNTIFFEKKLELAGVKFDLSGHGWATQPEKK